MRLILGKMLWNFDFAEADEEGMADWRDQKIFILWERQGVRLSFREKEDRGGGEVRSKLIFEKD